MTQSVKQQVLWYLLSEVQLYPFTKHFQIEKKTSNVFLNSVQTSFLDSGCPKDKATFRRRVKDWKNKGKNFFFEEGKQTIEMHVFEQLTVESVKVKIWNLEQVMCENKSFFLEMCRQSGSESGVMNN